MVIGSARDIVTWCGVPRFLYNDLPLGNPLGIPGNREMQRQSVERALALVETAREPTVAETEFRWSDDDEWKNNYMKVDASNIDKLRKMGEENRQRRKAQKDQGLRRGQGGSGQD